MGLLKHLFGRNDTYIKARAGLDSIDAKLSGTINLEFGNGVTSSELVHTKNEWNVIPDNLGKNVKSMGLHLGDDYNSMLLHYDKDGSLDEHYHNDEYQIVQVLSGQLKDTISDTIINKGEVFITPPRQRHHLINTADESYVYMMMSSDGSKLKISEDDLKMSKLIVKTK